MPDHERKDLDEALIDALAKLTAGAGAVEVSHWSDDGVLVYRAKAERHSVSGTAVTEWSGADRDEPTYFTLGGPGQTVLYLRAAALSAEFAYERDIQREASNPTR